MSHHARVYLFQLPSEWPVGNAIFKWPFLVVTDSIGVPILRFKLAYGDIFGLHIKIQRRSGANIMPSSRFAVLLAAWTHSHVSISITDLIRYLDWLTFLRNDALLDFPHSLGEIVCVPPVLCSPLADACTLVCANRVISETLQLILDRLRLSFRHPLPYPGPKWLVGVEAIPLVAHLSGEWIVMLTVKGRFCFDMAQRLPSIGRGTASINVNISELFNGTKSEFVVAALSSGVAMSTADKVNDSDITMAIIITALKSRNDIPFIEVSPGGWYE